MSKETLSNSDPRTPQDFAAIAERLNRRGMQRVMDGFGQKIEAIVTAFNRASPHFMDTVTFSFGKGPGTGKILVSPDTSTYPYQAQVTSLDSLGATNPVFKNQPPLGSTRSRLEVVFSEDGYTQTQGFGLRRTEDRYRQKTAYHIGPGGLDGVTRRTLSPRELQAQTDPVDLGFLTMISEAEVPVFVPVGFTAQPGEMDRELRHLLDGSGE